MQTVFVSLHKTCSVKVSLASLLALPVLIFGALCAATMAQEASQFAVTTPGSLISQAVDEAKLTVLSGNTHPLARPEFDLGTAPATLPMERMLLVLKRSPEQEFALRKLLDDQQDKHSPNYHKWLTPEEFGKQFGPSDADMQTITLWLQSHGFQVGSTRGRTVLEFSGSASQVQEAFHTAIHKYMVKGEQHWANANDPSIPTALVPAVAGVDSLHNFIKKPALHFSGEEVPAKLVPGKKPQVTFPPQNGQPAINALAPEDFAVIYNVNPVYQTNVVGNGVTIGVIGRSNLFEGGQDVLNFFNTIGSGNTSFGSGNLNIILNGPDPGDLGGGEEAEATLDSTWSGAIAPGATVDFVVSATTNTTDGIDLSETYIIENNLADVMTESFSACELYASDAQLAGARALAEQAAAQGITYFVSTGDNGAEGCDDPSSPPAINPISVNYLASAAYDVAVGGTMFNEHGDPSKYWTSTPPISETAISYIPEDVWNESSLQNGLWSGSGGASAGNVQNRGTTTGVPKPSWQYGVTGIPSDGVRDLPDVSLTAAGHDPYLLCLEGSCVPNAQNDIFVYFVSGTSASAPSFAGIMALIDQGGVGGSVRKGLANYVLYQLAAKQGAYPSQCNGSNTAAPPASTCIFNDVTVGNNVVPGETGSQYQAGVGYDMTTGLGSVNVANLLNNWGTVTFNPSMTALNLNGGLAVNVPHGQAVPVSITVAPNSGTGATPTGDVILMAATGPIGTPSGQTALNLYTLSSGAVSSSTNELLGGTYNVSAHYAGDSTYSPSDSSSVSVTVTPESSTITASVLTINANGAAVPFASGPFGSFVYLRADVAGQSGYGVPTGSVTFSDTFGVIPGGGTFALNSQGNTATPNGILSFDAGAHTISASYSGDASFTAIATTAAQAQSFAITPGFYVANAAAQPTMVIPVPGGSGQVSITVLNSSGFSGTISLACSGLPTGASCTLSPSSIKATGTFNATNVSVNVTTTAAAAMLTPHQRPYRLAQGMVGIGVLLSMVWMGAKQGRRPGLFLLLILALVIVAPSCGGGSHNSTPPPPPPTPAGTYNVTVTATNGSSVSTTEITLVVQ